jgi:hypothetical protein
MESRSSRFLTVEQADLVRQQIEAGRQFRGRVDALWEACEQLRLRSGAAVPDARQPDRTALLS